MYVSEGLTVLTQLSQYIALIKIQQLTMECAQSVYVICNRLYTIGGLDRWIGLVDWTTGLTFLPRKSLLSNP